MRTILFLLMCMPMLAWSQKSKKGVKPAYTIKYADSLFAISAWKDAIPAYEAVLKNEPANALGWNKLGFSYHNTALYDKAVAAYNKSLEAKPAPSLNAIIYSRLAKSHAMLNQKEEAFNNLNLAIQNGYALAGELQSFPDFSIIRDDERFEDAVKRTTENAFPCMKDSKHREFDFWVGDWDAYPNGSNQLAGLSKIEVAAGGCMILENWTSKGIMPFNGKSINYVNLQTNKWEQVWIGSAGNGAPQKFINGEYRDGAMRFEFEQTTPQGAKQIGRFIFFNMGPDQVRQFNEVSSDDGKTWTTMYDFIYKRRK